MLKRGREVDYSIYRPVYSAASCVYTEPLSVIAPTLDITLCYLPRLLYFIILLFPSPSSLCLLSPSLLSSVSSSFHILLHCAPTW